MSDTDTAQAEREAPLAPPENTVDPTDDTSAEEIKKAEKTGDKKSQGVVPNLYVGERVQVTGGDYEGRMGVILRIEYKDVEQQMLAQTANHPHRQFAGVAAYVIRTRDSENITISAAPEDVKALSTVQGWARGQV